MSNPSGDIQDHANSSVPIELDPDHDASADSTYETTDSYTTSLASSVMNYKYQNGRRYHKYRDGAYMLPNDETEQDRLDMLHHIYRMILGGRLFLAPLTSEPERVLDFGTGTGIWAIDFADEYPNATVLGTDLSPIQPTWVPPNVKFYVDDCEADWVYREDEQFDFVHGRTMGGSIRDWLKLYKDVYKSLKPGGWLEMQEIDSCVATDDDSESRAPNLYRFQKLVREASLKFGKDIRFASQQKDTIIKAGFADVKENIYKVIQSAVDVEYADEKIKIPVGTWAKSPKLKEIGKYQLEQLVDAIEPFCFGFLGKVMGWSEEECRTINEQCIKEIRDKRNHFYIHFHFVYGRKPESQE